MPTILSHPADEEWRSVEGFPGIYEVSNLGRVRRLAGSQRCRATRVLKPWPKGPKGHLAVGLNLGHGNDRLVRLVHRLVLAAFVGPCPDGMEVRHLDGDSTNNVLENLAYGTHSENELDKVRHGTHRNAGKTHCKWGHEFTPENTAQTSKQRHCRACRKIKNDRRPRKRAA